MARTANKAKEEIELPAINEQGITETMNTMTSIQSEYNDDRDLLNQLLGQAKMADAFCKFTATVAISKMAYVKESKLYQSLAVMKDRDGRGFTGTWEEFCKLLGTSAPKANEDINNLQNFGEEALESMSRMGIGYRELRQYRKLPEDQKTTLIEVAKAGDKEALVELAEEFIAKNAKEKEQLKKENSNLQADYKALSKRNADVAKEKEELAIKLAQFEMKTIPLDERLEPFKKQIAETQSRMDKLFEEQRQYVDIMYKLMLEILENDPDYDPEKPYSLPESMQIALLTLNGSAVLTLDQARYVHRELWSKFDSDIMEAQQRQESLVNENIQDLYK
jgi:chromosome segregation ATPase